MRWHYKFPLRLRSVFTKRRLDSELAEEIRYHLDRLTEANLAAGIEPREARLAALRAMGGVEQIKEECRDMRRVNLIENLMQDVRYGLRQLRRAPAFTAVALLTLALGIGANTAIFSLVNAVLLQPLPYPEPGRLVAVYETTKDFQRSSIAYPNFVDWLRENRCFSGLAVYRSDDFNFTGSGQPEHLSGEYVSAGFFDTLGARPSLGRSFTTSEDRRGAGGVVVLSDGFWRRRLASDPHVLGRSLTLNGRLYAVIGVLPAGFRFRDVADVFVPLGQWDSRELDERQVHPGLHGVARLKPGVTLAAAEAEMTSLAARLAAQYPVSNGGHGVFLAPLRDDLVKAIRPTLLLLLGAVGFVLVIGCSNVANLLLARSNARGREFALRAALGAGSRRIVRQLLTESVLLAGAGGALGLLAARAGIGPLMAAIPESLPATQSVSIDPHVLLFTFAVSVLTGILFGLAPALRGSSLDPYQALKEGSPSHPGSRGRAPQAFIAIQIALATVLLAGAGLMTQSIWRLWRIDPGFDIRNVFTAQIALSPSVVRSPAAIRLAYREILSRVNSIPGVQAATLTNFLPLSDNDSEIPLWLGRGPQPPPDQMPMAMFFVAAPEHLRALGIPLLQGRFFTERDNTDSPHVAVIDEVLARQLFPGQSPLGRVVNLIVVGPVQIVGVAGHVKHWGLDADESAKIRGEVYFPLLQIPDAYMTEMVAGVTLAARTAQNPLNFSGAIRAQVAGPTEDQPMYGVRTMEQIVALSLAERRFAMVLLVIFAVSAVVLACVGIYGVISYLVSRRTRELALRMALGASRGTVFALVIGQGMSVSAIGLGLGIAGAFGLTRLLSGLLYGVRPADPLTFTLVPVLIAAVAFLACFAPARKAARLDPAEALRSE